MTTILQTKKIERVTILMPAEDAIRLKHFAIDEGRSTSAIARDALRKHMDSGAQNSDAEPNRRKAQNL